MSGTPFTPELAHKLLDKLSTDDKFRAEFERDPHAALVSIGAPPAFVVGGCLKPKHLASKKVIKVSLEHIRAALLGRESHSVHCLDGA